MEHCTRGWYDGPSIVGARCPSHSYNTIHLKCILEDKHNASSKAYISYLGPLLVKHLLQNLPTFGW